MKKFRLLALLAALMLVIAACTSDGGTDTTEAGSDTTAAGSDTTAAGSDTTAATETTEAMTDTTQASGGDTGSLLDEVMARGELNCGTRDAFPGFAVLTEAGDHVGFDSDFCRVIAAAILGDAEAVNHVDLETADRFTALQSGQIDVLVRNTTWTASRDGSEGATFVAINYYDGQGMMVAADSGFESLGDMDGVIVCVAQGTTT
ncbi:MAG: transporter substrate-binding domain-containing protein, partial [Acidimicrobiia bacterium]